MSAENGSIASRSALALVSRAAICAVSIGTVILGSSAQPRLPDHCCRPLLPTTAARPLLLDHADADRAEPVEFSPVHIASPHRHRRMQRPGHDELACLQAR